MKRNVAVLDREAARGRERAFTLVELMAVVVTLAMLAAVVLPALAFSDDNGTRMVCLNNLRQMAMAAAMYAEDNRDYLAFCNWDSGYAEGQGWLYGPGSIPNPSGPNQVAAWKTGLWFQYVQNQRYYLCPVDIESPYYSHRINKLASYVMNGSLSGFSSQNQYVTCKTTDAWNPGCWLLWEPNGNGSPPASASAFVFNDGANYPGINEADGLNEGPGAVHTVNGSEILSVAGNVQFATTQKIQADENTPAGQGAGPGGKTLGWWSPFSTTGH
jgi:type II secretory pathway pseudopilin PulG